MKYRKAIEYWWFKKQKYARVISSENLCEMGQRCFDAKGWKNGVLVFVKPISEQEQCSFFADKRAKWYQYKSLKDLLSDEEKIGGDPNLIATYFERLFLTGLGAHK